MLPIIRLDDEMYAQIMEQVRSRIMQYSYEWTDYNEHDPGITFLELFAWLKEAQQYYMDHQDREMQPKYLQLLGLQCRCSQPASGWLLLNSITSAKILPGTQFYAGKLCLTLTETAWNSGCRIASMTAADGTELDIGTMYTDGFRFYPFTETPEAGGIWTITSDQPLPDIPVLTLFVDVFEDYPMKRNPLIDGFPHLMEWKAQVKNGGVWQDCTILSDDTASLMRSGRISLKLPDGNVRAIRFCLTSASCDVPPLVTNIRFDAFAVSQIRYSVFSTWTIASEKTQTVWKLPLNEPLMKWDTQYYMRDSVGFLPVKPVSVQKTKNNFRLTFTANNGTELMAVSTAMHTECPVCIGTGDGFPNQVFELHLEHLFYEAFSLLIYDSYDKHWHIWQRTDNLLEAGHLDRVYRLDERMGTVIFGDGIHGRMPDGEIRIVSMAFTRAEQGNLQGGCISDADVADAIWDDAEYRDLNGGTAAETPEQSLRRGQDEWRIPDRAVTIQDYETIVRAAPGLMIRNCHVTAGAPDQNRVNIAFEPYTLQQKAAPNSVYKAVLEQFLEPRRLIGTEICIHGPMYADIHLIAEIYVYSHDTGKETEIRRSIEEMFRTEYHVFGKPVLYSAVYAAIESMNGVRQIRSLVMQCRNSHVRITPNSDLFLPENGLPCLSRLELKLVSVMN